MDQSSGSDLPLLWDIPFRQEFLAEWRGVQHTAIYCPKAFRRAGYTLECLLPIALVDLAVVADPTDDVVSPIVGQA
jgi:hypothetical protein